MARPKPTRSNSALRFALIRQLHVYVSVFVAPSLIFFAATGALQTFRLPDRPDAPMLLVKLARLHKDDVFAPKPQRPKPPPKPRGEGAERPATEKPPAEKPKEQTSTTVMKWFFSLVSIAIVVSTLLGLWMAVAYNKRKAVIWLLLLAGAAAPILILTL